MTNEETLQTPAYLYGSAEKSTSTSDITYDHS